MIEEDLPCYLSYVLEDLLNFHIDDPIGSEYDNLVLQQLNVQNRHPRKSHEECVKFYGKDYKQDDAYSAKRKEESYRNFSQEQAYAIQQWLQYVKTWKCFAWESYQDDIDGALEYWGERCSL